MGNATGGYSIETSDGRDIDFVASGDLRIDGRHRYCPFANDVRHTRFASSFCKSETPPLMAGRSIVIATYWWGEENGRVTRVSDALVVFKR